LISPSVWCSSSAIDIGRIQRMPSASRIRVAARPIGTWAGLNSPRSPRWLTTSTIGIMLAMLSEASALVQLPRPLFCISRAPRRPASQAPESKPTASSSLVVVTTRHSGSAHSTSSTWLTM